MVEPPVVLDHPDMADVAIKRDISYSDDPHARLDLYRPKGRADGLVVLIHGAADIATSPKDWGLFRSWGRLIAASGHAVAIVNHRLGTPGAGPRAGRIDLESALAFLRANSNAHNIDAERMCIVAFSGGGLLLASELASPRPGLVCLAGFYPLLELAAQNPLATGLDERERATFSARGALTADKQSAPILIVRAGADAYPGLNSDVDAFASAALNRDRPVTLVNVPGAPHGFENQLASGDALAAIRATLDFLAAHLGT